MFIYKGSTALITGASKGLGVTFAEELARRRADLVLVARSKDALQTLAARLTAQYGVKCYVIAADLANPRTIDDIYAELSETGVPVDLLINNAALGLSGRFLDHDHSKEQASIQVNVQALVGLSHRFGRAMSARGRGGIINIASNSAFQPLPYMATYAASKAFVLHFGEALQHELSPRGVRVMTACPGPTATSFFEGTPTTMSDRSFDTPEMVVRAERTVRNLAATAVAPQPDCPSRGNGDQKDGVGVREDRFATRCGQWSTRTFHAGQAPASRWPPANLLSRAAMASRNSRTRVGS